VHSEWSLAHMAKQGSGVKLDRRPARHPKYR
jgi:hypothetical protein